MDDLPEEAASTPELHRIALIGTGLASTSLALAWKENRPDLTVTGLDAPDALDAAESTGAIDQKAASIEAAVDDADLVVLSGRLPALLRRLEDLAPHLAPGALVTDTGTVKQPVLRQATDVLPENVPFIGGHPVPASEHPARTRADASYFDGGTYLLCPPETPVRTETPNAVPLREQRPAFFDLVAATGATVQVLSAARHDRLCATARDLPDVLSAALAKVASEEGDHELLHALAPPAFRPLIWGREAPHGERREELVGNEGAVLDALGRYVRVLQQTRRHLAADDLDAAFGTTEDEASDE